MYISISVWKYIFIQTFLPIRKFFLSGQLYQFMTNAIKILSAILENPFIEKPYRELIKYYNEIGMIHESKAISELIETKFHADHPSVNNQ